MDKESIIKKVLLIIVVAMGVYINSLPNGFVWDDEEQVVNNVFIRPNVPISYIFSGSTFGGGGASKPTGGYYKPLMSLWYRMNFSVFGLNSWGWHLSQSFLHGVNGDLIFLLLLKLLGKKNDNLALFLSLVFVMHPGNVESVAYVASAQEVLSTLFLLMSMLVVVYRDKFFKNMTNALMISCVFTFLSMLSKETGVLGVVYIWWYLYLFEKDKKYLYYYPVLLLPVAGIYAYMRFGVANVGLSKHEIIPIVKATFSERMMTVPYVWWRHVWNLMLPLWLFISDHYVVKTVGIRWLGYVLTMFVGISAIIWRLKRGDKLEKYWLVWLLVGVLFTLNLYPLDMTFAERWSYLPMIGYLGFVGVLVKNKFQSNKSKQIYKIGGLLILLVFGVFTWIRQYDWRNGLKLFEADVKHAKGAFDLHNNYGVELWRSGDKEKAALEFEKSAKLSPEWWTNWNNLGAFYETNGDLDKAREYYQTAINNGDYFLAWENLAKIKFKDGDEDVKEFVESGLKRLPNNQTLRAIYIELEK